MILPDAFFLLAGISALGLRRIDNIAFRVLRMAVRPVVRPFAALRLAGRFAGQRHVVRDDAVGVLDMAVHALAMGKGGTAEEQGEQSECQAAFHGTLRSEGWEPTGTPPVGGGPLALLTGSDSSANR